MKFRWLAALAGLMLSASQASAAVVLYQQQNENYVYVAQFAQVDLAQSFQTNSGNIAGAGIFRTPVVGSGNADITISLWSNLPNAAGALLTSGTANVSSNNQWVDVFWSPVALSWPRRTS